MDRLKNFTILFAEDEPGIREATALTFRLLFKEVYVATDGNEAEALYRKKKPDIVLADIGMPGCGGLALARRIREEDQQTPIVMLTAHSDRDYLLEAANLQLDGYLLKPLNLDTLTEAMDKCLRRIDHRREAARRVHLGGERVYDLAAKELLYRERPLPLGKKEGLLLELLIEKGGKVLSREELAARIWAEGPMSDSALKNLLNALRKKVGAEAVANVPGRGWRLVRRR